MFTSSCPHAGWCWPAAVFDAKRLIGRKFDEPCVQSDAKLWPFKIENKGGKPVISVDYKGETLLPVTLC